MLRAKNLIGTKGRMVADRAGAEEFLRDFVRYLRGEGPDSHVNRHSKDCDLYLPWVWENVSNAPTEENPPLDGQTLDRLYMDAAWGLVTRGYLRPGPRSVMGESGTEGKGFTLTEDGERWVAGE